MGLVADLLALGASGLPAPSDANSLIRVLFIDFTTFCTAGLLIGAALGALDGLLARRGLEVVRGALRGGLTGLVGGLLALLVAEVFFRTTGATGDARQYAWIIFGAPFGAVGGFKRQTPLRLLLGLIGGAYGGLIGGFLANAGNPLGLTVMGFLIGFFIGLLHDLFKQAWLKVISGRNEGREVVLDRASTVLGSADVGAVDFGLYGDPDIASRHVEIRKGPGGFEVVPLTAGALLVNGKPVGRATMLNNGDQVQLGNTRLVFLNRRS